MRAKAINMVIFGLSMMMAAGQPTLSSEVKGRAAVDTRPYEFIDAKRDADEITPWIDFEADTGWRAEGGTAQAELSQEQMLFGKFTLKVSYGPCAEVRVRPAEPLALPVEHDWFGVWIRNAPENRGKEKGHGLHLVFRKTNGEELRLPLPNNYWGNSKLDWPDWWYVVRKYSKAELKTLAEPGLKFDGFVIKPASNAVPCVIYFDNIAFFNRDETKALEIPRVPDVHIPTRPEGALPASLAEGGVNYVRREGKTTRLGYEGPDGKLEYVWTGDLDTLRVSWNDGPAFRPTATGGAKTCPEKAVYAPSIVGKTLVLELVAPAGEKEISLGHVEGAKVNYRTLIPMLGDGYWWANTRSRVSVVNDSKSDLFVLVFPDWYVSAASRIAAERRGDGTYDRVIKYMALTDGSYNVVKERIYVTVSPELMETLPVIANPVSPWKHVTGKKAWSRYSASTNRAEDIAFLTRLHRYGIRDLVINEHEGCMRDDGESFTFRDKSAPKKGGDKAWRKYADYLINTLGYYYGPYNNFTDFPPVNANWRFDRVARRTVETDGPDAGGFVTAWTRCYNPKTAFGYASCVYYAARLKEKYGFNTAYCDVHTSKPPWSYVDYDACVPGAGTFQNTYRAYAAILLEQKKAWGGPVYSEGDCQFFYAGLSDGNYAQPGIHPDKNPWIVDFNLKRIHPLECDFGMGNPNMFNVDKLPTDSTSPRLVGEIDRFLAATLAYGNSPFLVVGMMFNPQSDTGNQYPDPKRRATPELGLPYVLRSYFMVLPAAKRYTQAEAEEIRYLSGNGAWRTASAALFAGDYEMRRIAVRYSDDTVVVANGDKVKRLKAEYGGRKLDLPPCGYAVWNTTHALEIEASDRFGARTDYSESEEAIFLDTRDAVQTVAFEKARGKGLAVCRREGDGWEVIPVRGEIAFRVPGDKVVAYDEAGREIGTAEIIREQDGFVTVRPVANAFSYRIMKGKIHDVPEV